ncbi:hypothetical protein BAZSYMA_ACONTIG00121_10 [Bathymodiolus azoricus thioautotrophic gill symbiont]|uniref:Uncharacterized protein n=1 Tax=Bathymodiolus azoricus thioautotrophic gill symbiont TaxID=235205 RepID=A0A1H6JEG5_9GAMM|nr:hypothetical protein BAZSYMA_ACONTIG00121_10 [Bathymodiolus azoricus thioautotrophic gill symbiont]
MVNLAQSAALPVLHAQLTLLIQSLASIHLVMPDLT